MLANIDHANNNNNNDISTSCTSARTTARNKNRAQELSVSMWCICVISCY